MKKLSALLLAMVLTLSLAACGGTSAPQASSAPASEASEASSAAASIPEVPADSMPDTAPTEKIDVRIATLKGPAGIGLVKLMDAADKGEAANNYEFTMAGAPDELTGKIIQGDFDIATVPTNLAAALYNKTNGKVKLTALSTMGVLYIVENGDTVKTMEDLRGKTIYATGKGSTPEFVLNYLLEKNGMKPGTDVTVEYKSEHTELANLLAADQAKLALLPQPFVTSVLMANEKVHVALDLTKEWEAAGAGGLTMTGVLIQQKFIDEHPDAVKTFLEEYSASVAFVTNPANLDAAAELVVAREIMPKAAAAKQAIPACNIVFKSGEEMKTIADGFFKVLFDADPQSVGGKLPDENLYYMG